MLTIHRRLVPLLATLVAGVTFLAAPGVHAFSGGITSTSFSATNGCNDCHSGGMVPTVTLTGPAGVDPSSTHEYTLTVSNVGSQDLAGLNVAIADGLLAVGGSDSASTQALTGAGGRDEITHTAPKAGVGGVTTFTFLWTAPAAFTNDTMSAWGNAVNGNLSTTGDHAAHASLDLYNPALPTPTGSATPTPAGTPPDKLGNPIPRPIKKGNVKITLQTVATGFDSPVTAYGAPGVDPSILFVVDQSGILWRLDTSDGSKTVFLDVSSRLVPLGVFGPGTYDERGFLGIAFDPDYQNSGLIYTFTSEPATPDPDFSTMPPGIPPDCQTVINEWHVPNPSDPASVVDTSSVRQLLRFDKPQFNHNSGTLQFGPDGMLYIGTGDGGGADDQDGQPFINGPVVGHGPNGNGQNLGSILGKLLRIDPHGNNSANGQYGIPASNPFVAMPGALGEIWAYGFRNPYRFSFDTATQRLYVGDVGQNDIEEVDIVARGGNYGWHYKEGSFFFRPNGTDAGYVTKINPGGIPPGLIDPVGEYDHGEGIAVVGGFVAHSPDLRRLKGNYVFGDLARTFSNDGRLFYLRKKNLVRRNGTFLTSQIFELRYVDKRPNLGSSLLGFGQGNDGSIFVLVNQTAAPAGGTGSVLRMIEP